MNSVQVAGSLPAKPAAGGKTAGCMDSKGQTGGFLRLLKEGRPGSDGTIPPAEADLLALLQSLFPAFLKQPPAADPGADPQDLAKEVWAAAGNPELAERLSKDPKFQLWMEEALPVLSAAFAGTLPVQAAIGPAAGGLADTAAPPAHGPQEARVVLAALASLLQRQPDLPAAQTLARDLAPVLQPLLPGPPAAAEAAAPAADGPYALPAASLPPAPPAPPAAKPGAAAAARPGAQPAAAGASAQAATAQAGTAAGAAPGRGTGRTAALLGALAARSPAAAPGTAVSAAAVPDDAATVPDPGAASPDPEAPVPAFLLQLRHLAGPAAPRPQADPPGPPVISASRLAEELPGFILKHLQVADANGGSEARISLYPQHLGQVDIRISVHNGVLEAHFMAETLSGKELLENQLPQLKAALLTQGLQVERLDVSQSGGLASGPFLGQRQEQPPQQSPRHNRGRMAGRDLEAAAGERATEPVPALQSGTYGFGFDVTA